MFRIYDTQKNKWREETNDDKFSLLEEFRDRWYEINYDCEYTDIINSDLNEDANVSDVDVIMKHRAYGVSAEKYLKGCGFEARKHTTKLGGSS